MKVWIHIQDADQQVHRVCWYMGTSDASIEKAVRMQLQLPVSSSFLLRDADGDFVPIASTLPHGQTYALITDDQLASTSSSERTTSNNALSYDSQRIVKRRKLAKPSSPSSSSAAMNASIPVVISTKARSLATIITQFLETFTRPIASDDNVNFIPNTGTYALYALYCALISDRRYHPKNQDAFYKITSMVGKIDRQRVIRYYHDRSSDAFVQYKPQGKGPFLRQYVAIPNTHKLQDVITHAVFLMDLGIVPEEAVAQYMTFIQHFAPIAKSVYQAHQNGEEPAVPSSTTGLAGGIALSSGAEMNDTMNHEPADEENDPLDDLTRP